MDSLPYNPLTDFTPIALVADLPIVLVVHNSVQANSVAALIAQDKANPGKVFYGSAGVGTTMHLSGELFNVMAGTQLHHVAYKGAAPAVTDLLSGTVQAGFLDLPSAGPHIASGRLEAARRGQSKASAERAGRGDHLGSWGAGLRDFRLVRRGRTSEAAAAHRPAPASGPDRGACDTRGKGPVAAGRHRAHIQHT